MMILPITATTGVNAAVLAGRAHHASHRSGTYIILVIDGVAITANGSTAAATATATAAAAAGAAAAGGVAERVFFISDNTLILPWLRTAVFHNVTVHLHTPGRCTDTDNVKFDVPWKPLRVFLSRSPCYGPATSTPFVSAAEVIPN